MNRSTLFALTLAAAGITNVSQASEFKCDGKEMTKGEVIKTLINNPKAQCQKIDLVVFDQVKGTIRNAPKN